MRFEVNLGEYTSLRGSRFLGTVIKPHLDALVMVNLVFLRTHTVPPLYRSGVIYRPEPPGQEEFASIPAVLARGWGDCDDIGPWRVAELRLHGEPAKIRIQWKKLPNGKLFHVLVRRANGDLEDPCIKLGMP